jgi:hypothetical protein
MTLLGVIMALRHTSKTPSTKERAFWIACFFALLVTSVVLSLLQQIRVTVQQKGSEDKAEQSERLRIKETQYMTGKLDTISAALGAFATKSPDLTALSRALSGVARQSPEDAITRRRAEAQTHLGKLLSEGLKLSECYKASDGVYPTSRDSEALHDWEDRTYSALAIYVNPALLPEFGGSYTISVAPGQEKWLKTLCWSTRHKAWDLQSIMAREFSPILTEGEKQRRSIAQIEIGKILGEGQLLYDQKCTGVPPDNQKTPSDVDSSITAWESKALSVVAASGGPKGMEQWDQSGNAFPGPQKQMQQRCGHLNMRLSALRNVINISF